LGGASPTALTGTGGAPSRGAQTTISVGNAYPYFAVQAYGTGGQLLGTSPTIPTPAHLAIYGASAFVAANGIGGVPASCFTGKACLVTATLTAGRRTVASTGRENLGAGGGVVLFKLSSAGQRLLARARGHRLPVTMTVSDSVSGVSATVPLNLIPFATSGRGPRRSLTQASTLKVIGVTDFVSGRGFGGILAGCFDVAPCMVRTTITTGHTVIATTGPEFLGVNQLGYLIFTLTSRGRSWLVHSQGNQLGARVTITSASGTAHAGIALVGFR
jgi:hypothetical protein